MNTRIKHKIIMKLVFLCIIDVVNLQRLHAVGYM